ncbi:MAG: hypothetical protein IPJ54_20825 [Saprospiraceae bacterium]|nr:hypothetical protein [Saprospiraceae bacterium]
MRVDNWSECGLGAAFDRFPADEITRIIGGEVKTFGAVQATVGRPMDWEDPG